MEAASRQVPRCITNPLLRRDHLEGRMLYFYTYRWRYLEARTHLEVLLKASLILLPSDGGNAAANMKPSRKIVETMIDRNSPTIRHAMKSRAKNGHRMYIASLFLVEVLTVK